MLLTQGMETSEQVRRNRLAQLVKEVGSVVKVANTLGCSSAQVSQWLNGSPDSKTGKARTISNASARKIEKAFNKPVGWMDHADDDQKGNSRPGFQGVEQNVMPYFRWPFRRIEQQRFLALPQSEQDVIEGMLIGAVQAAEARIAHSRATGSI